MMATDQPQTEQSTHVWAICHPPDTKYLTWFLTTETIQTCFSNWKIKFSWASFSLTPAVGFGVFFSGFPSIAVTAAVKHSLSTHPHHRCTQRCKALPPYLHSVTSLGCCLLQHCWCSSPPTTSQIVSPEPGSTCAMLKEQDEPCTSQIPEQCTSRAAPDHCGIRAGRELSKTRTWNDFIFIQLSSHILSTAYTRVDFKIFHTSMFSSSHMLPSSKIPPH